MFVMTPLGPINLKELDCVGKNPYNLTLFTTSSYVFLKKREREREREIEREKERERETKSRFNNSMFCFVFYSFVL